MAGEPTICIIGNLTESPSLKFTPSGAAVANFTVASTPRTYNRDTSQWDDGEPLFMRCAVWRDMAENVADSLDKGTRVIVSGYLKARSYQTKEGENRTVMELDVQEVGPSLRFATARVAKTQRGGSGDNSGWGRQPQHQQQQGDPWGEPPQQQRRQPSSGGQQWNPDTGTGGWGNTNRDEPPF